MPKTPPVKLNHATAERTRKLVYRVAKQFDIPPVYVTAHVRSRAADAARLVVWRVMIGEMGFRRHQVARMFNRDRRRLRASVIGV
jgi:hypothetical protein